MDTLQTILIIVGFAIIFYFLVFKKPEKKEDDQSMVMMQDQLKEIRQSLTSQQTEIQKTMQGQFSESAQVIRNVTERLTKLDETNKQVIGFTEQLQSLEKILTNSKTRGALGEANLELILNNILPPQAFQMQYRFKSGETVDAIVKIKDKILPIDAKFSLTNYQRIIDEDDPGKKLTLEKEFKTDLKKRIDELNKELGIK